MPPSIRAAPGAPPPLRAWWLAIPLLGAALAYRRALDGGFVFDDLMAVVGDPLARDLAAATRALVPSLLAGGRPVTTWTFALGHALGGPAPRGFHLVNLGCHLAVALLVFAFTRRVLDRAGAARPAGCALAVAGAFALHPLHAQAVNYVTQRAELVASGAYLGALLLLLPGAVAPRGWWRLAQLGMALLTFAAALGAKPIAVTMPLAYLLLVLLLPDQRPGTHGPRAGLHLAMVAPFLLLAAWQAGVLLVSVEGRPDAGFATAVRGLTPITYLLTQARVVPVYARLLFWPVGQSFDWLHPVSARDDLTALGCGAALVATVASAAALAWRHRHRDGPGSAAVRVACQGLGWWFLVLAPTSSFVPLADLLVEHRPYLASWGLLVGAAVGIERLLARLPRPVSAIATAAAVGLTWAALGLALHRRNAVWESPVALWADAVARQPGSGRARAALARALHERGDGLEAIAEYGRALAALPREDVANRLAVAEGLGVALADLGRPREAVAVLGAALALRPGDPDLLATLGAAQLRAGDLEGAERNARAVLAARPGHPQALLALGECRLAWGDAPGAVRLLADAVAAAPGEPVRLLQLGVALGRAGRGAEACAAWREAAGAPLARAGDRQRAAELAASAGCPARPAPDLEASGQARVQ